MEGRDLIGNIKVKFEPRGAIAELDFKAAIDKLNAGEAVFGVLGKDAPRLSEASFFVHSIDSDNMMEINVLKNQYGAVLAQHMGLGLAVRFSAKIECDYDEKGNPVVIGFSSFYADAEQ